MQVVIDSKRYNKLLADIDSLFVYEETADQYDAGARDGGNHIVAGVKLLLSVFWSDITT